MAAVAEALHSEVECDSNHQEISQAVFCVTGPMQQDQLPEDAKVRVVNISGCDKERQDQLVSVFLSEACGVPVHLESNEDDMDDMDDNGSARTVVLKGQDGDHLVLLLSSEMCEIQLAPGILAHMVHILGDPEDANLDALFCAMPERTDDISLSLLFPEDLPESIWSGLAATSKSAGFRSVSAVPLCHASSLSHELAQHIMSAPAIPFQKLVESYNNALQSETRDGIQKRMVANKQAVEGVAESAELYAQRLESYTDHLPLPKDKLVEVSNDAVRECWDKLNARLEYLDLTSDESAAHKAECMRRISRDQTNLCKMNMLKSVSQCWQVARERWSSVMDSLPPEHMASHLETERRSLPVIVDLITHFTKVYESDPRAVGPAKLLVLDGFMREKAAVVEHLVHLSEQEDVAQKEELRFALDLAEAVRQQDVAEMLSSMRFMEEVQAEEKMYVQALEASYERRAAEVFEETLAATNRAAQDAADQQQAAAQQAAQRAVDVTNQAFDNLRNVSERLGNELSDEADKLNSASENLTKLEQDIKELNKPKWYETLGQWLLVGASAIAGVALCVVGGPVGALVGGMLLSAGLSTGMKMAFNGGTLDWKEFGVSVGVGAATGLVSGGIGLGVGAALSGVTGAIGVASCGTKLLVGGIHAAAQAAGGAVSSMAGTVIDNLAHQRTWHEGLGQAATAGAVTGFVSGSIAGFSACREAASKAAEASKAAKTSVEQIGSRAAEVAPTKALCKAGAAFLESASTGTVDGLLTAAFDSNINLGDAALMGFVGGCVAGAAGAAIAGGRAKWEARRQKKVIEQMKKDGFLDANGVPTDKHEHSYLHHSATITEAEQITRITTGIDGTEPTPVSGAFHDGDSLKKVSVQADAKMTAAGQKIAADMNTNPDSVKKLTKLQSREVRLEKLQERNDYILSKMKSSTSKADRKALGKQLGSLKQKRSTLHRHIKGANDEKFAARTIEIGEPQAGGSWGSSLKKEDGVIKQLKDCKAAAVNVKYTFGVDHGQVIVTKTSIVSAYPMAADGQKYIKPKMLKLDPLNAVKHQVAVQQAARNMAKATNPENLPDGWATAVTHEGQRYFFNKELGRVQWEHPYL